MQTVQYDAADIVALFAQAVGLTYRTRLLPGGDEPLYRPASQPDGWHEIIFRHDYFQSALHEIAHWCVAGQARRQCVDFGYWYEPDGRNSVQQATFERVEARPQAVEWVLSAACGKAFYVSLDNLGSEDPLDEESLWRAVHGEVLRCLGAACHRGHRFLARHSPRITANPGRRQPIIFCCRPGAKIPVCRCRTRPVRLRAGRS